MSQRTYFLGANSAQGFYSCYDSFCPPEDGNFLWVIKGGPGCGKSSFMRKLGQNAEGKGYCVEYVVCSGDPDSLDGIYIPDLKLGYVDGTAPHVQEPAYPAVRGAYLNLGEFYDTDALAEKADAIIAVQKQYRGYYREAYRLLAEESEPEKYRFTAAGRPMRLLSAITCNGIVNLAASDNCVKVSPDELMQLINSHCEGILYLHPLWPDIPQGLEYGGVLYLSTLPIPSCREAVTFLAGAKELHDRLEAIYNPHVNFDGVYRLAREHMDKIIEK